MTEEELRTICQICSKQFQHLGSHIWQKHHIYAKDYKDMFGLDHKFYLTTERIHNIHYHLAKNNENGIKNLLKFGKKTRIKKNDKRLKYTRSKMTNERISELGKEREKYPITELVCQLCNKKFYRRLYPYPKTIKYKYCSNNCSIKNRSNDVRKEKNE